jgi:transposase InsO family protein
VDQLCPGGLLQPLDVPSTVWVDIAMDFVERFPRINDKSIILTVVDRFSKFTHFISLGHPYTATSVAHAFFTDIVRLHGLPSSITSDHDPVFTSKFWQELFSLAGVKLNLSSAFHPQSDGQLEAANKVITMYLCCLTGDRPRQWLQWLPWVEYCYNTAFHSSLKMTPFNVVYGRDPPRLLSYASGARLPTVHHQLQERDEFLLQVRERLE